MEKDVRFLNMALSYKKQYKECAWWKFKKRKKLYKVFQGATIMMKDRYIYSQNQSKTNKYKNN